MSSSDVTCEKSAGDLQRRRSLIDSKANQNYSLRCLWRGALGFRGLGGVCAGEVVQLVATAGTVNDHDTSILIIPGPSNGPSTIK